MTDRGRPIPRQRARLTAVLAGGMAIGAFLATVLSRTPAPDPAIDTPAGDGAPVEQMDGLTAGTVEIGSVAQENAGMRTVESTRAVLPVTVEATGVVAPVPSRIAHVRPLARGVVEEVQVHLGDRVRRGQALITYDNVELGDLIGEYRRATAALRQAEAKLDVRRRYLDRAEALIEIEAIARQILELRRAELENARAAVASAGAELARVEEKIHRFGWTDADLSSLGDGGGESLHREASYNVIVAPLDGIVTGYDVAVGETVEPDRELLTITDISTVWVLADVYEEDLGRIQVGADAHIRTAAYPDRVFTGRVTYISDVIESATRTARVRSVVANAEAALKLDMFATIAIPTTERREALSVPSAAVQQIDGVSVMFVQVGPSRFERREVALGRTVGDRVEVLTGVAPGETVVAEGSFYLKTALLRERIGTDHAH